MVNVVFVVIMLVIIGVPLVRREEDMRKNAEPDIGVYNANDDEYFTSSFASFLDAFLPADQVGPDGYLKSSIKRTKKYVCYVREAVKQNMECSLQCLKYLYACENV